MPGFWSFAAALGPAILAGLFTLFDRGLRRRSAEADLRLKRLDTIERSLSISVTLRDKFGMRAPVSALALEFERLLDEEPAEERKSLAALEVFFAKKWRVDRFVLGARVSASRPSRLVWMALLHRCLGYLYYAAGLFVLVIAWRFHDVLVILHPTTYPHFETASHRSNVAWFGVELLAAGFFSMGLRVANFRKALQELREKAKLNAT